MRYEKRIVHELSGIEIALEGFVDRKGLTFLLEALGNLCCDKLVHLQETWQQGSDDADQIYWETCRRICYAAAHRTDKVRVKTGTYLK
jgi:hypothetical protein